ncbi:siderophore ABC transporter substrate-binding protein [Salinicoccus hispanicus]|uniref:ABC transporter substrate-binding protein n=1 Tax=Salinicoccus hispanicus TaxID=157225 RepID=A0A6N8TY91_9STAP|nr:ABC transporter substrate-binding protein [Salinicoccus hispanicus]MXQ50720.1 ABC transporter substrate-binding protein [Salinicoccus hispanicus]
MKKFYLLIAVMMIMVIAACGNTEETTESTEAEAGETGTVSVENNFMVSSEASDGEESEETVSETIEVPLNPEKVAVFDYGALSTIKELGEAESVVGLPKGDGGSTLPEELDEFRGDDYENLGGLKDPDFEKIAELQPDLIMISGRQATDTIIDEFGKAAPDAQVLFVGPSSDNYFEEIRHYTQMIGDIFDKSDEAEALIGEFDDKIEEVKQKAENTEETLLFVMANEGELSAHGPGGRYSFLYDELGFKTVDEEISTTRHGQAISYEYINDRNPGIILALDRGSAIGGESASSTVLDNNVIQDVDAIKNDRVIDLNAQLWYLASGGIVTTIGQLEEVEQALEQ